VRLSIAEALSSPWWWHGDACAHDLVYVASVRRRGFSWIIFVPNLGSRSPRI
jgi:hypothetical protein